MAGLNKVQLIGRLGKDPEVKHLEGGSVVANFSVAIGEKYKNKAGEWVEKTEWVNVVAWGNLAGICEKYIKKGSQVYVEGKFTTRSWDDSDGNKKYSTEVLMMNLVMLDSKGDGGGQASQASATTTQKAETPAPGPVESVDEGDDLPF